MILINSYIKKASNIKNIKRFNTNILLILILPFLYINYYKLSIVSSKNYSSLYYNTLALSLPNYILKKLALINFYILRASLRYRLLVTSIGVA